MDEEVILKQFMKIVIWKKSLISDGVHCESHLDSLVYSKFLSFTRKRYICSCPFDTVSSLYSGATIFDTYIHALNLNWLAYL
jgi:hypothetical protein